MELWVCDKCGYSSNWGRFCLKCGTEHPSLRSASSSGEIVCFRTSGWSGGVLMNSASETTHSIERQPDGTYALTFRYIPPLVAKGVEELYSLRDTDIAALNGLIDELDIQSWVSVRSDTPDEYIAVENSFTSNLYLERYIEGDSGLTKAFAIDLTAVKLRGLEREADRVTAFMDSLRRGEDLVSRRDFDRENVAPELRFDNDRFSGMTFLKAGGEKESAPDVPQLTLEPIIDISKDYWQCRCGKMNTGNFCMRCGARRP